MSQQSTLMDEEMQRDFALFVDEHDKLGGLTEEEEKITEDKCQFCKKLLVNCMCEDDGLEAENYRDDDYKNRIDELRGK